MRIEEEKIARLALIWSGTVGAAGLGKLISVFGSARAAIEADAEQILAAGVRLPVQTARRIPALRRHLHEFEGLWRECERRYIRVVFREDEAYPPPLREIPNPPWLLSIYGSWLTVDDPAVAIVGTRRPTADGLRMAGELAKTCARRGITVVSGLARGIDQAAHRGALSAGGRTVAVVGCGLLAIDRRATGGLESEIAGRGAVLSEVGPYAPPSIPNLMARNRLTSGLARLVVVVQSRRRGGALVTAANALKQGRMVAAVPWPDDLPEGIGCARLLEEGAEEISSAQQLEELLDRIERPGAPQPRRPADEDGTQQLSLFD